MCSGFQDSHCSSSCLGFDDDKELNVKNLPSSGLQGGAETVTKKEAGIWKEEEFEDVNKSNLSNLSKE